MKTMSFASFKWEVKNIYNKRHTKNTMTPKSEIFPPKNLKDKVFIILIGLSWPIST